MTEVAQALALGLLVGGLFAFVGLVPPAPATIAGAAGVIGITAGALIVGVWR